MNTDDSGIGGKFPMPFFNGTKIVAIGTRLYVIHEKDDMAMPLNDFLELHRDELVAARQAFLNDLRRSKEDQQGE